MEHVIDPRLPRAYAAARRLRWQRSPRRLSRTTIRSSLAPALRCRCRRTPSQLPLQAHPRERHDAHAPQPASSAAPRATSWCRTASRPTSRPRPRRRQRQRRRSSASATRPGSRTPSRATGRRCPAPAVQRHRRPGALVDRRCCRTSRTPQLGERRAELDGVDDLSASPARIDSGALQRRPAHRRRAGHTRQGRALDRRRRLAAAPRPARPGRLRRRATPTNIVRQVDLSQLQRQPSTSSRRSERPHVAAQPRRDRSTWLLVLAGARRLLRRRRPDLRRRRPAEDDRGHRPRPGPVLPRRLDRQRLHPRLRRRDAAHGPRRRHLRPRPRLRRRPAAVLRRLGLGRAVATT